MPAGEALPEIVHWFGFFGALVLFTCAAYCLAICLAAMTGRMRRVVVMRRS